MIYGIGTDICEIARIEQSLARFGERFALKVLGPSELEVFRARRAKFEVTTNSVQHPIRLKELREFSCPEGL